MHRVRMFEDHGRYGNCSVNSLKLFHIDGSNHGLIRSTAIEIGALQTHGSLNLFLSQTPRYNCKPITYNYVMK